MDRMDLNHDGCASIFAAVRSRRAVLGSFVALALVAGARASSVAAQDATPASLPPPFDAWLAVWGQDPGGADALYAADAVLEDVTFGAVFRGAAEIRTHVEDLLAGFPGHAYDLRSAFVAGNSAAAEFQWTATYSGAYPGLPAGTGQVVSLRGAIFIDLEDGLIVREAHYYDAYTFLVQLGVLPAPATPAP